MKIKLLSDLHLEFGLDRQLIKDQQEAQVLVLAGDIAEAKNLSNPAVIEYLKELIKPYENIIYILGNHEYYNSILPFPNNELKDLMSSLGIKVLDDEKIEIDGFTFIGSTMWTDFNRNNYIDKLNVFSQLNDYRLIQSGINYPKAIMPDEIYDINRKSIGFIVDSLENAQDLTKTVVITHHGPSFQSVVPRWRGSNINAGFCMDLDDLLFSELAPRLWLHGHIHDGVDYEIDRCRVVANPKGYGNENKIFNRNLIIEI